jgi:hypothetical protein
MRTPFKGPLNLWNSGCKAFCVSFADIQAEPWLAVVQSNDCEGGARKADGLHDDLAFTNLVGHFLPPPSTPHIACVTFYSLKIRLILIYRANAKKTPSDFLIENWRQKWRNNVHPLHASNFLLLKSFFFHSSLLSKVLERAAAANLSLSFNN